MLYASVGVLSVFVLSWWFLRNRKRQIGDDNDNGTKPIPGPNRLPVIGNLHHLDKHHMQRTLYKWMGEYGHVFKFSLLSEDIVVVSDAALMREVFDILRDRPESFPNELNHNRCGVTLSNFDENQTIVKEITFRIYHDTFQDPLIKQIQNDILDEFIGHLTCQTGGISDVHNTILRSVAEEYVAEITGNKPCTETVDASLAYFACVNDLFAEGRSLVLTLYPWLRNIPSKLKRVVDTALRTQNSLVEATFEDAIKTYKKGSEHGMLQRFISRKEEENSKSGHELVVDDHMFGACVIDVVAGSLGGTSANISMCILYMLLYPEVYTRVNDEISQIKPVKSVNEITEKDVPYLTAFIMECMRLSSVIHITLPHHVDTDMVIAGYKFKKHQLVMGSVWNVHHSETTWGDPFDLRPERFLDESGQLVLKTHPARQAFIPFGTGVRDCKGKDTAMDKIFRYISKIVYVCDVKKVPNMALPSGDPRDLISCVALDVPEFSCIFTKRHHY